MREVTNTQREREKTQPLDYGTHRQSFKLQLWQFPEREDMLDSGVLQWGNGGKGQNSLSRGKDFGKDLESREMCVPWPEESLYVWS